MSSFGNLRRRQCALRLAAAFWAAVGLCLWGADPVEFVQITDSHLMKLEGVHPAIVKARRHYENSSQAMERFLVGIGAKPPAFILHTGDIVDAFRFDGTGATPVTGQIEHAMELLKRAPAPLFLTLGNHDIHHYREAGQKIVSDKETATVTEARRQWRTAASCFRNGTYYAFSRRVGSTEHRFLVLDNGERVPPEKSPFLSEQLKWLAGELAKHPNAVCIAVMHIPLSADEVSEAIKSVLARSSTVALIVAGHRHTNGIEEIQIGARSVPQVRTAAFAIDERHVRRFRLFEDRIEVFAPGQPEQLERSIPCPAANRTAAGARLSTSRSAAVKAAHLLDGAQSDGIAVNDSRGGGGGDETTRTLSVMRRFPPALVPGFVNIEGCGWSHLSFFYRRH